MHFETKIWHPNISSVTGEISLNILRDEWSPALTIHTMLISLQVLMSAPQPEDPLDIEVAEQYFLDKKSFEQTARNWTKIYAKDPNIIMKSTEDTEKIKKLMELGFSKEIVEKTLEMFEWNEEGAMDCLLGE